MPRSHTIDLRWNALLNDFRRGWSDSSRFPGRHRRQISLHSFRKHLYRPHTSKPAPSDDRSSASADHHFLPVTILPDPTPSSTDSPSHLELILPNGRRIAVAAGFDPQTLRRLIAAVEGPPCSD